MVEKITAWLGEGEKDKKRGISERGEAYRMQFVDMKMAFSMIEEKELFGGKTTHVWMSLILLGVCGM